VGWCIEEQSDPSIHNCSTFYVLGFGLHFSRSGSFAHSNLLGQGHLHIPISSVRVICTFQSPRSWGHLLAKWPTSPRLKHVVVALADVEPSLGLGAAFFIAFIFCAWAKSLWVLLFLFLNEGLISIDSISRLISCICSRICCTVRRS
jgi:hypothetical protein